MKRTKRIISVLLSVLMIAMLIPAVVQAATLTTVTVKKTDANGNPLAGAVFTLAGTGNYINQKYNAESNKDGVAEFVDVKDGDYELAEEMAPDGYIRSTEVYKIAVRNGVVYRFADGTGDHELAPYETITFVNEAEPTYAVTVKKTDKDGNPLAGAVFTLTGTGNSIGKNYEATSDKDGNAVFNAREGWYTLAESVAPDGYLLSDVTYDLVVSEDGISTVKETDNGYEYTPVEKLVYENEAEPTYPVTVKKTDKDGNPLAGAVFTLIGTGNSIGKNYEATSDKDGNAVFHVREGYYTLAEKTAPEGYTKSDKTYEIAVWGDKVHFVRETDNQTEYTDYEAVVYVNEKNAPPTGDGSRAAVWLTLLLVSGGAAVGAVMCRRKKAAA